MFLCVCVSRDHLSFVLLPDLFDSLYVFLQGTNSLPWSSKIKDESHVSDETIGGKEDGQNNKNDEKQYMR